MGDRAQNVDPGVLLAQTSVPFNKWTEYEKAIRLADIGINGCTNYIWLYTNKSSTKLEVPHLSINGTLAGVPRPANLAYNQPPAAQSSQNAAPVNWYPATVAFVVFQVPSGQANSPTRDAWGKINLVNSRPAQQGDPADVLFTQNDLVKTSEVTEVTSYQETHEVHMGWTNRAVDCKLLIGDALWMAYAASDDFTTALGTTDLNNYRAIQTGNCAAVKAIFSGELNLKTSAVIERSISVY